MTRPELIKQLSSRYDVVTSLDNKNLITIKTKIFGSVKYKADKDVVIVNKNLISCGYKWIIQQLLKDEVCISA